MKWHERIVKTTKAMATAQLSQSLLKVSGLYMSFLAFSAQESRFLASAENPKKRIY